MPFSTVQDFKNATVKALQDYRNDYTIFKNTYDAVASGLEKTITLCETKEQILEKLFSEYKLLLARKSTRLLFIVTNLIADELGVSRKQAENYNYIIRFNLHIRWYQLSVTDLLAGEYKQHHYKKVDFEKCTGQLTLGHVMPADMRIDSVGNTYPRKFTTIYSTSEMVHMNPLAYSYKKRLADEPILPKDKAFFVETEMQDVKGEKNTKAEISSLKPNIIG